MTQILLTCLKIVYFASRVSVVEIGFGVWGTEHRVRLSEQQSLLRQHPQQRLRPQNCRLLSNRLRTVTAGLTPPQPSSSASLRSALARLPRASERARLFRAPPRSQSFACGNFGVHPRVRLSARHVGSLAVVVARGSEATRARGEDRSERETRSVSESE
jgi:hypothetical protein